MQSIKLKELELNAIKRKGIEKANIERQLSILQEQYKRASAELEESTTIAFSNRNIKVPPGSKIELNGDSLILHIPVTRGVRQPKKEPFKKPVKKATKKAVKNK